MTSSELAERLFEIRRRLHANLVECEADAQRAKALAETLAGLGYSGDMIPGRRETFMDDVADIQKRRRCRLWDDMRKECRELIEEYMR